MKIYEEPIAEWMKLRSKSMIWNKEEKAFNQKSKKKKESQKTRIG